MTKKGITISREDKEIQEAIKKLALARMKKIPEHIKVSIGSGEYTSKELVENIEDESQLGKQIIEMQINFVRDMAQGKIHTDE